ncbi:MAG: hypothetical protein DI537_61205, partial [Stutzerimonas stutzeri]
MASSALSLHFGRGEPPSRDLRDYLAEDDKWILGEWVADDEVLGYGIPYKPEWAEHFQNNYMADQARYGLFLSTKHRMENAWERYNNPDQPAETPASTGLNLRLSTAMPSLESDGIGQETRLQTALRLTFGVPDLMDGVEMTVVLVSLFAIGETLYVASRFGLQKPNLNPLAGGIWMTKEDWKRSWKPWLRGTFFGFPIGALPAGGAEIPTFLSYTVERKLTKHPEEFGNGAIEGVAGPEAANNAAAAGVLVPLLTLGLPTSATAAILLAAFQNYGLQPGPML